MAICLVTCHSAFMLAPWPSDVGTPLITRVWSNLITSQCGVTPPSTRSV